GMEGMEPREERVATARIALARRAMAVLAEPRGAVAKAETATPAASVAMAAMAETSSSPSPLTLPAPLSIPRRGATSAWAGRRDLLVFPEFREVPATAATAEPTPVVHHLRDRPALLVRRKVISGVVLREQPERTVVQAATVRAPSRSANA